MKTANISGKRIREARRAKNLNQVELAAALSVDYEIALDQSDISEIERGVRAVKDYELVAIAHILEIDVGWLLLGKKESRNAR